MKKACQVSFGASVAKLSSISSTVRIFTKHKSNMLMNQSSLIVAANLETLLKISSNRETFLPPMLPQIPGSFSS